MKTHNPTVSVKIHNPTVCVTDTHPSPHASLNLVSQRYRNLEKSGGRGVSVYSDFFHGRSEFMDCFFLKKHGSSTVSHELFPTGGPSP